MISIIIPAYNVEKYIDKCLKTIVGQTYSDLEIIIINDGSTDSTLEKAKEWQQKDSRIVVVSKENGGVSSARNAGLEIASGEYVGFADPDDYMSTEYFEIMHKCIRETDSQIVMCGYSDVYDDDYAFEHYDGYITNYTDNDPLLLFDRYLNPNPMGFLWNKLYKKEVVEGCLFPDGIRVNEDTYFNSAVLAQTSKVTVIDNVLYGYRQRTGSALNTEAENPQLSEELLKVVYYQMDLFEKTNNKAAVERHAAKILNELARRTVNFHLQNYTASEKIIRLAFEDLFKKYSNCIKGDKNYKRIIMCRYFPMVYYYYILRKIKK